MIIAGAGGHAREIWDILSSQGISRPYFFDNISPQLPKGIPIDYWIKDDVSAARILLQDPDFILGTGNPIVRKKLYDLFMSLGGRTCSCVASSAIISNESVEIGEGVNIMHRAFISNHVQVGKGSLINTNAHLHHDVQIGDFCELGPGSLLLGKIRLGNYVFVGAGAILLPGVQVDKGAVIGAGAVVTKNIPAGITVKGSPAR